MIDPSHVQFADSLSGIRRSDGRAARRVNAFLSKSTEACRDLMVDGSVIRIELYHVRQARAGAGIGWHRHPFMELTWVEGCPVAYEKEGQQITLNDGEFFVMPAFLPHRWQTSAGNSVLHGFMLTIVPATDREHSLASRLPGAAASLAYRLPGDPAVADALRQAEAEALQGDALGVEAAAGYLRAGLARLFRPIKAAVPADAPPAHTAGHAALPAVLEQAVMFIATHLAEPIGVSAVARHVGMSTRQLDRLFNASFDMPTGAFLLHTRLEQARYLLHDSDLSIKQVAHASGFADPNYFSRIFRKRHGQSPGAYRGRR